MSFDHWWASFFVDEREHERFKPAFSAAAEKAILTLRARQALESQRDDPSAFDQSQTNHDAAAAADAFIWAFNLPGFDRLAEEVLTQKGAFADFDAEKHHFRFVIAARHTPVSIVWRALGYDKAVLLPGLMGNMLLSPREIDAALEKVRRAHAGSAPQARVDAARAYCGWSVDDDTLQAALSFLPEGLARAKERNSGFLALARPQI
jgi:hypothetical protein